MLSPLRRVRGGATDGRARSDYPLRRFEEGRTGVRDLTEEEWLAIDDALFDNNPLLAVKLVRQRIAGLGLHQAGDVMRSRYLFLRRTSPQRFTATDEEYWSGWYS